MRYFFITTFLLFTLSGCSLQKETQNHNFEPSENIPFERDYSEVDELHILWSQMFSQNLQSYYVYFYSTNCNHCQSIKNEMVDLALKRGDIFFVKGTNKDTITSDVKSTIGVSFAGDFSILGYPSLAKIVDGKVEKNVAGKSQILALLK